MRDGTLDGLRIDHVDGLLDPKGYLVRLRESAPRPFYLVVEKILARHETLREDWPVEGTTGYEFANLVLGLLIDPAGEAGFTEFYSEFAGANAAVRRNRPRLQDPHHDERNGKRTERACPRRTAHRPPEPAHGGLHAQYPAARAQGDRRLLPGLSHLCR